MNVTGLWTWMTAGGKGMFWRSISNSLIKRAWWYMVNTGARPAPRELLLTYNFSNCDSLLISKIWKWGKTHVYKLIATLLGYVRPRRGGGWSSGLVWPQCHPKTHRNTSFFASLVFTVFRRLYFLFFFFFHIKSLFGTPLVISLFTTNVMGG